MISLFLSISLLRPESCGSIARPLGGEAPTAAEVTEWRDAFVQAWLDHAELPPPTIDYVVHEQDLDDIRVFATPLLVEQEPWNQWPGDSARLMNQRAAIAFSLRVESPPPITWLPERTSLELNRPGEPLFASPTADDAIAPLIEVALLEERFGLEGDLTLRARGAGPFRASYLPLGSSEGALEGLVVFHADPSRERDQVVFGMRLVVALRLGETPIEVEWVFD